MPTEKKIKNRRLSDEPMLPWGTKGRFVDDKKKLAEIITALRTIGAKIVLTMGAFDFIHIGHFLYLEKGRSHGDVLIVGVDSDAKVRARKGPDRPIVDENERVQMLTHVRHVDIVTLKRHDDPKWALIKLIKPDTLIATKETYTKEQLKQLKKYCGDIVILEPQATTSTTAKLRRLNIGLSRKMQDAITESINETFEKLMKNV
ncbi:MAG: adenylyltransferase/cytidyltransferase family protein [bacterium]|nr:adenylyltransferase/cytidyltransferase family protein [bacterium]